MLEWFVPRGETVVTLYKMTHRIVTLKLHKKTLDPVIMSLSRI